MRLRIAILVAALATPAHASLFEHLAGKWVMRGTIGGKQVTHDVDGALVLNRGYARLHEVDRRKNGYEAILFVSVDKTTGEYACLWLDNTSNVGLTNGVTARAKPTADSIPFEFRDKDGKVFFRTTFVYDAAKDSWQWLLDDWSNGKAEPFARVTLTRR